MKNIFRILINLIFGLRRYNNKKIKQFADGVKNKKILELGSGKMHKGSYYYSAKNFFDSSNEFIQTDINPAFEHKIVDVTKMDYINDFDIILCMNVLEHVFEYERAVSKLNRALRKGGTLIIFLPMIYPLHDEPNDFWRFTEWSIKRIFKQWQIQKFDHLFVREFPFAYYIELVK